MQAGSVQVDVVHQALVENGALQPRPAQQRAAQVALVEHDLAQVGPAQIGLGEVHPVEQPPRQLCIREMTARQVEPGNRLAEQHGQGQRGGVHHGAVLLMRLRPAARA
ncbi:hypothetical protein D3C86_1902200 [compost metagenome]